MIPDERRAQRPISITEEDVEREMQIIKAVFEWLFKNLPSSYKLLELD